MSKERTIKWKQDRLKQTFLDQLKRTPVIEQACQKTGVGRTTLYRWRREGTKFSRAVDDALVEGRALMSDVAESQLFSLIGEKDFKAIRLYLATHNKRYSEKLELSGVITSKEEPLTKEQRSQIRRALKLSSLKAYAEKTKKKKE